MILLTVFLTIIPTIIIADQTIYRSFHKLNHDVTALEGGSSISFVLTFLDINAAESTLEIETQRWVHECCLEITNESHLRLYLKQNRNNYPKVTVHLRLRRPLSYIGLHQTADLVMQNTLTTDKFFVVLVQSSRAQINIGIDSYLYVSLSDTAKMVINGHVTGAAEIYVQQAAELDTRSCPMDSATIDVNGGVVRHGRIEYLSLNLWKGLVTYNQSNESKMTFDFNWFEKLFGFMNTATRTSDQSIYYIFILFILFWF